MQNEKENYLLLNKMICFQLYSASRTITSLYRPLLKPLDLTYPQYLVMLVLWEEEQVNVKHLGERLLLDSGTLTPLLKKLQSKNLITRQRSVQDERHLQIALTQEGKDLREKAVAIPHQLMCRMGLHPENGQQIHTLLHQLLSPIKTNVHEQDHI